jgi:hypothetical protein
MESNTHRLAGRANGCFSTTATTAVDCCLRSALTGDAGAELAAEAGAVPLGERSIAGAEVDAEAAAA